MNVIRRKLDAIDVFYALGLEFPDFNGHLVRPPKQRPQICLVSRHQDIDGNELNRNTGRCSLRSMYMKGINLCTHLLCPQ